ncbi:MAG: hypothetical protein QOF56_975 [Acidobacteriaceae bacterium]|nr:hypothetical protein [Acidobacteriaceae bacterium]
MVVTNPGPIHHRSPRPCRYRELRHAKQKSHRDRSGPGEKDRGSFQDFSALVRPQQINLAHRGRRHIPVGRMEPQPVPSTLQVFEAPGKAFSVAHMSAEEAAVSGHTLTVTAGSRPSLSLTLLSLSGNAEVERTVRRAGKSIAGAVISIRKRSFDSLASRIVAKRVTRSPVSFERYCNVDSAVRFRGGRRNTHGIVPIGLLSLTKRGWHGGSGR